MKRVAYTVLAALFLLGGMTGCNKKVKPGGGDNEPVSSDISQFVWYGLNDYYLWYADVPKLSYDHWTDDNAWYAYLNGFGTDYESLFEDLLYQRDVVDKWSWIVDDWEELENSFAGISKSMGYDFRLVILSGSDDIFGYVRYVVPGSPADIAGIKRGDLFMEVDGIQLTLSNYYNLLFGQDSYELSMASITDNIISLTGVKHDLTAVVLQENPVHLSEVIDIGDGLKTGYLVYNAFTSDFDYELNEAFGVFKSEGIDRLILDLRYNGGGSIRTAIHLASMIYSTDTEKVFSRNYYNNKLQDYLVNAYGPDFFIEKFTNLLDTTTINHSPPLPEINNLGLSELYVITTGSTASASEMIINGLDPYLTITQVGSKTTGKYVGSITVKDYYTTGALNTAHKWAMQPIVLKVANSQGVSDFVGGLPADVSAVEDIANLLPFGDPDEPLLKATIDHILGIPAAKGRVVEDTPSNYIDIMGSDDVMRFSGDMYIRYPKFNEAAFAGLMKDSGK